MQVMKASHKLALAVFIGSLLTSCGQNLQQVKDFGLSATVLKEVSNLQANDIYQSCMRGESWKMQTQGSSSRFPPISIEETCESMKVVSEETQDLNRALIDYITLLGALAGNSQVNYSSTLALLQQSANNLSTAVTSGRLSAEPVKQIMPSVNSLLNIWTTQFRRAQVGQLIRDSNCPLQSYIKGLVNIEKEVYLDGVLTDEKRYFRQLIEKDYSMINSNSNALLALTERYEQNNKELERRREAAYSYIHLLVATGDTHNALAVSFGGSDCSSNRSKLDTAESTSHQKSLGNIDPHLITPERLKLIIPYLYQVKRLTERIQTINSPKPHEGFNS